PGTTISLTLLPTFIEVRDKGVVKKKIPLKERSFDDVALELQKYIRYLGKRLAPGVLEDVLDKIGLPKARRVLKEELITPPEPEPEPEPEVETIAPQPEPVDIQVESKKKRRGLSKKKEEPAATFVEGPGVSADEVGEISVEDFDDIADALQAVESLSDSFMTGVPQDEPIKVTPKPKISIQLNGQEEIVASHKSYARIAEAEKVEEIVKDEETEEPTEEFLELVAETVEEEIEPAPQVTPAHQIKPIVECKGLLLGEDGVGKETLKAKAEIVPITLEDGEISPYIFGKVFEGDNHRIDLRIWSFDLAVKTKVQRKQFYSDSQIIMIVYAASDRWSFESIDFWLREATLSSEEMPPLVIVANKIDLRTDSSDDTGDQPVSYEEGFQFAEELAKRFGNDDELHPVAFIETSCVSGEGVEDAFKTAVQLFENTL
ncbi:MAG: Rab family GTPase, partial [Candidatus Thorarchaeota archaeon]